jgi:hypothetical protein
MKRAHLLFTVLPLLFMPPAFGREPELNVKAICKASSDDAKIMGSTPDQSVADCVRDEDALREENADQIAFRSRSFVSTCCR